MMVMMIIAIAMLIGYCWGRRGFASLLGEMWLEM